LTELVYYDALARASGGDTTAIDRSCTAALQQLGQTRNPDRAHWLAALCVLAEALDESATARTRDLAGIAAELEPDLERFVAVFAAAQLRAGDGARAAALLQEILDRPAVRERSAETWLVHALAQRAAGDSRAAMASLGRFQASPLGATMPWHRRYEANVWQRFLQSTTSASRFSRKSVDP
jgi:hypothetical protein